MNRSLQASWPNEASPIDSLWGQSGKRGAEGLDSLAEQAEAIVAGRVFFEFNGRRPIEVGRRQVDWSGGHVGHQEWRAQLNRFFHLLPLTKAYEATADERYAQTAREHIEDWLDQHDQPHVEPWPMPRYDNTLNLAIRCGTCQHVGWLGVLPLLAGSPSFESAFVDRMIDSVRRQLNFLMENLVGAGNQRIAQADALVTACVRLLHLDDARRWRTLGVDLLIQHGSDAMADAFATLLNHAMRIEREQVLGAASHQRTDQRRGYANGFKPKTMTTRVGELPLHSRPRRKSPTRTSGGDPACPAWCAQPIRRADKNNNPMKIFSIRVRCGIYRFFQAAMKPRRCAPLRPPAVKVEAARIAAMSHAG